MPGSGHSESIQQAAWETEELFEQHFANLTRYLRSGVRDTGELEDLAQETFIRYFQARCNGETIDKPKAWLYRVGRRLALDHAKKSRPVLLDDAGWRAVEAEQAASPATEGDATSLRTANLPWHQLSALERECLLLRAEGLTFREVAEVLDVSISTVASYVGRAIQKFRRAVEKPSETPQHSGTAPVR